MVIMRTEEEAKATRCCGPTGCGALRPAKTVENATRVVPVDFDRFCIGSACMAWRASTETWELPADSKMDGGGWSPASYTFTTDGVTSKRLWSRTDGECGLAAK